MLYDQLILMLLNISGLATIIYLSFLIIFVYHKYPYRRYLIRFLLSLSLFILSLILYSRAGHAIIG